MDKKIWKIIGAFVSVLLVVAVGFCTIWTIRNWNVVYASFDGTSIHTEKEVKDAYQNGYNNGAKNEAEYIKTIAELRDMITKLTLQYNNEKAEMQGIIDEYKQIFQYVKEFIENVEMPGSAVVMFETDDGILYDIHTLEKGATAGELAAKVKTPTKNGYHFVGWSLNGSDVVDLSTLQVNENITLIAVFEINVYSVKFMLDKSLIKDKSLNGEELLFETTLTHGSYFSAEKADEFARKVNEWLTSIESKSYFSYWEVLGYSYEEDDMVKFKIDFTNYPIMEDTVFYARVGINMSDLGPKGPGDLDRL